MKVRTFYLYLSCGDSFKGTANKVRGFFGERFGDYTLIHHHLNGGKLIYKTPLIQYKVFKGKPLVIGINEGGDVLRKIYEDLDSLKVDSYEYEIKEKTIVIRTDDFEATDTPIIYSFLTPWLALNEENYEKYCSLNTWDERKRLLERILVGNIISVSKSVGYTIAMPINAEIIKIKEVNTKLKGNPMIGFVGRFSINFKIPPYWGIGKSVSRGFGTIVKCDKK